MKIIKLENFKLPISYNFVTECLHHILTMLLLKFHDYTKVFKKKINKSCRAKLHL